MSKLKSILAKRSTAIVLYAMLGAFGLGVIIMQADFSRIYNKIARQLDFESRPVLVELYTSQSNASSLDAAPYFDTLLKRKDVLALSFHTTYWDDAGWRDPLASDSFNMRQDDYGRAFDDLRILSPIMVVDGRFQSLGFFSDVIDGFIKESKQDQVIVPIRITNTEDNTYTITLKPVRLPEALSGMTEFEVSVIAIQREVSTAVTGGENNGKTLVNHNVVKDIIPISGWKNTPYSFTLRLRQPDEVDGLVVVVQEKRTNTQGLIFRGRIAGAKLFWIKPNAPTRIATATPTRQRIPEMPFYNIGNNTAPNSSMERQRNYTIAPQQPKVGENSKPADAVPIPE